MDRILTVRDIQEEYNLPRKEVISLLNICYQLPRKPKGKRRVMESEFKRVLYGRREI